MKNTKNERLLRDKSATYKQSNCLVNACYKMGIDEKRMFLLMLSKMDSKASYEANRVFKLTVSEFEDAFPSNSKWVYRRLQDASNNLLDAKVHFLHEDATEKRNLMSGCKYVNDKGSDPHIEMTFNFDMMKHISELSERFTKVRVCEASKLSSVNALRIYEIIISKIGSNTSKAKKIRVAIDDIKKSLCIENKYKETKKFISDVIKKSADEINRSLNITVFYEVIRSGRKATHIDFTCLQQDKGLKVKPKRGKLKKLINIKAGTEKALEIAQYNFDVMTKYKDELHAYDSNLKMPLSDLKKYKLYADKLEKIGASQAIQYEIENRLSNSKQPKQTLAETAMSKVELTPEQIQARSNQTSELRKAIRTK